MARVEYDSFSIGPPLTFNALQILSYVVMGGLKGSPTPPTISNVSPAVGAGIRVDQVLHFDVTDNKELQRVIVVAKYTIDGDELEELVHSSNGFGMSFVDSTREAITNGFRYGLRRTSGWPAAPTITVYAFDTEGTEST